MEAVTSDGGNHTASVWWLSPDIILNGLISGPDKADPGIVNPVQVRFHRKGAESNCIFPGSESITVQNTLEEHLLPFPSVLYPQLLVVLLDLKISCSNPAWD